MPGFPPWFGCTGMLPWGVRSGLSPGGPRFKAEPSETQLESLQQEISPVAASHMNENDPPWA